MNVYVKDSQLSADLSTLSATGKAQKGKKFFVDLLMLGRMDQPYSRLSDHFFKATKFPIILWYTVKPL